LQQGLELCIAAQDGNLQKAKSLVSSVADAARRETLVNSSEYAIVSKTPLVLAIANGHTELALYLLENGEEKHFKDKGMTAHIGC
jgi:ankyrin repeat protein